MRWFGILFTMMGRNMTCLAPPERSWKTEIQFTVSDSAIDIRDVHLGTKNFYHQENRYTTREEIVTGISGMIFFHQRERNSYSPSYAIDKARTLSESSYQRQSNKNDANSKRNFYFSLGMVSLIINSSLLFAAIMRSVIMTFNLSIGIHSPLLMYGILFGLCCRLLGMNFLIHLPLMQSFTMYSIVVPIMLYRICSHIDLQGMKRNIFQTLVISGPGFCANAIFAGITARYLLNKDWNFVGCIVFGTACAVIYPKENMLMLEQLGPAPQHVSILLEGETIFGTFVAFGLYNILHRSPTSYLETIEATLIYILKYTVGGIVVGYIIGKINNTLFKSMSSNVPNIVLFNTTLPLVTHYICTYIIGTSGLMAILICGLMMHSRRTILNKSSTVLLRKYWEIISFIAESIVSTAIGTIIGYEIVWNSTYLDYVSMILVYCSSYCARFLIYVILAPITSRLGYGMSFPCLVLAVWGGTPSLINICIAMLPWPNDQTDNRPFSPVFFYLTGMVVISHILNTSTLSTLSIFLKMEFVSTTSSKELRLCLEHLKSIRIRMIVFMKIENLMGETAWNSVEQLTLLRSPYEKGLKNIEEDQNEENIIFCSECKQQVYLSPGYTENLKRKERTNLRLLCSRETLYIDYFCEGLINEYSFNALSSMVRKAFDHCKNEMEMNKLLELFETEICCTWIRNRYPALSSDCGSHERPSKPPNNYWWRLCYHIVRSHRFHIFMLAAITANGMMLLAEISLNPGHEESELKHFFTSVDAVFVCIFTIEFLINIAAHSVKSFWRNGFKSYFGSKFNAFDFGILITVWISFVIETFLYLNNTSVAFLQQNRLWFTIFKSLRLLRVFEYCEYPRMVLVKIMRSWKHRRLLKAYNIGKDFWILEKRLQEEILPLVCADYRVRKIFRAQIEQNLCDIVHELKKVQHDFFWISLTVKTKYAIKLVVASMMVAAENLMMGGWTDGTEQDSLNSKLLPLMNKCDRIKKIMDNDSETIFRNATWLKGFSRTEMLLKQAEMRCFNSGDTLFEMNTTSDGIYVIVSGTCNISYVPTEEHMMRLETFGEIPVFDRIISKRFEEIFSDDSISAGVTLGEMSFLTGRNYAADVTVDFPIRAFFIPSTILKKIMAEDESQDGLECRLWEHVSKHLASSMLMASTGKGENLQNRRLLCLNSLTHEVPYYVSDQIDNIVLIDGIIQDPVTSKIYKAPCLIPRSVKEIVFPDNVVIARILLILSEEY